MTTAQVALYARVSSEQQAEANTIASQLAELRVRIGADGFDLKTVLEFIDEGYSGSTLVRPALERLRDVAAAGELDRLYVHCPDRFARHYASASLVSGGIDAQGSGGDLSQSTARADPGRSVVTPGARGDRRIRAGPRFSSGADAANVMPHKKGK
jgi:Resolvase, N terminal domain